MESMCRDKAVWKLVDMIPNEILTQSLVRFGVNDCWAASTSWTWIDAIWEAT